MRRLAAAVLLVVATACGGGDAEPGSKEELAGHVDALNVPPSMTEVGDTYVAECPAPVGCPSYVRWYETSTPSDVLRTELTTRMEASGVEVNETTALVTIFSARTDTHIFFVVLDPAMIANNEHAPAGADAEISVHALPEQ
jgi:hypothetical protein